MVADHDEDLGPVIDDPLIVEELAKRARAAWDDPSVLVTRDRWVNYDDNDQIVAWGFSYGLLP